MKKTELLQVIKDIDYAKFNDFVTEGGDINLKIRGKSLLEHAVLNKSDDLVNLLLLYGAELAGLYQMPEWLHRLQEMDQDFPVMVKEIEDVKNGRQSEDLRAQRIISETSRLLLGNYPLSHRNVMFHKVRQHGYSTKLWVGIHLFEYRSWEFLTGALRRVFQCSDIQDPGFNPTSHKKYAMILTATTLSEYDEEIPGLSKRIRGFVEFLEISASQLDYQLECMAKAETLVLGIRFSDEPSLVENGEGVDVDSRFYDSMKEIIGFALNPRLETRTFTFDRMKDWDDQLNGWVQEFKAKCGFYPNILQASSATYSRIDLVANSRRKERLIGEGGKQAPEGEFISMSGFAGAGYELDFCMDEKLAVDSVKLIFDSDPNGGLPVPAKEKKAVAA